MSFTQILDKYNAIIEIENFKAQREISAQKESLKKQIAETTDQEQKARLQKDLKEIDNYLNDNIEKTQSDRPPITNEGLQAFFDEQNRLNRER
jgi:DNA-binding transcriptional regulator GbsR (MarR family)